MAIDSSKLATRVATLEEAKRNQEIMISRFFNSTWPTMENTLKKVSEQLAEAKLDRAEMKATLTGLTEKVQDLPSKASMEKIADNVEHNCARITEVKGIAAENQKTINSWKSKGTIIGFGLIALVTVGFNLLGEGLKKWIGLK